MRSRLLPFFLLASALTLFSLSALTAPAAGYSDPIIEEIAYASELFAAGDKTALHQGLLILEDGETTAVTTSPILAAPFPFNAVVPQWRADLPDGALLDIELRTQNASGAWSDWQHVHEHGDWSAPVANWKVGDMVVIPQVDGRHTHIQLKLSLSRAGNDAPRLHELKLVYIDSTDGPTVAQMMAQQRARDAGRGVQHSTTNPRPTVISRDIWCTSVNCDYSSGLEYADATHMLVHHTVSNNASADWAATLRAIWSFHTHSLEWDDVGYNYLIDPDGVIYEGHLNEDYQNLDVAGTHAGGANTGSMGVALLGTYTEPGHDIPGVAPSGEMLDALVALLSWKAEQRSIDVYEASDTLPNLDHGLPHLASHRDVYGNTECPGDQAHALIPLLTDRVAQNMGQTNPYIVIDERSVQLTRGGSGWFVAENECGSNGHAYYVYSEKAPAPATSWGEWRPTIGESAVYRVDVRIPYCYTGRAETAAATYQIDHAYGSSSIVIDQNETVGLWVSLGLFELNAGSANAIRLTNQTATDSGLGVWFDEMRLLNLGDVDPFLTLDSPKDDRWLNSRTVTFDWSHHLTPLSNTHATTLQVSTTADFSNVIVTKTWSANPNGASHTFGDDAPLLYWRVTTTLGETGETISSPVGQFGIDTAVPTSTLTALYAVNNGRYQLHWTGSDSGSGIAGYDLAYRPINDAAPLQWTPWLTKTVQTAASFTLPDPALAYELRIQAVDNAGNTEPKEGADGRTPEAITLPHAIILPIVTKP